MILNKIDTFKKTISHKFEKYNFLNVSICVYYILKNKRDKTLANAMFLQPFVEYYFLFQVDRFHLHIYFQFFVFLP